jgi:hypothetical protein
MANPFVPPLPRYFGTKFFAFMGIREGFRRIFLISGGLKSKSLKSELSMRFPSFPAVVEVF